MALAVGTLRLTAAVTAVAALAACATGGLARRAESPSANVATCRPARLAASPVLWSCVIPPGDAPIVHGLSGIHYDKATSKLWAASDDDESYPRDPARLLRFTLTGMPALTLDDALSLTRRAGPDARESTSAWQLEALAPVIERGTWTGSFFVATENDALIPGLSSQIYRCTGRGACEAALAVPRELESAAGSSRGIQENQGIEGLTASPDGTRLFAAVERSLAQEQPATGARERVRLIEYVLNGSPTPARQYAYALDPAPANTDRGPGVSEILALSRDQLLVLERSFFPTCGNTIRVFEARLDPSRALAPGQSVADAVPLEKQLLIDLADEKQAFDQPRLSTALDNFEGMTLGPDLPDGSPTLLLVTDDNLRRDQITALVSLRLSSLPTPAARRWRDGDPPPCPR